MAVQQCHLKNNSAVKLVTKLINDFSDLLNYHVELYKHEAREDTILTIKIVVLAIMSALVAYTGFIFFGLFLIFALSTIMPIWSSALLVTIIYVIISVIAVLLAKNYLTKIKEGKDSVINQTIKTLEVAKSWLRELK